MKNPFQKIIDQKAAEEQRLAEEQRQREERLRQLEEESKKKKGFHIPHPVQSMQNKKEIKNLRREIAAYEDEKKRKTSIFGLAGMAVICLGLFGILALTENKNETKSIPSPALPVVEQSEKAETAENTESSVSVERNLETAENVEEKDESDQKISEIEELGIPKLTVDDLDFSMLCDYAHNSEGIVILGNNEGATITIEAAALGLTADDIIFAYDEEALSVTAQEPYEKGGETCFKYYVTGKKECSTEIDITTTYDYLTQGDNLRYCVITIMKLSSSGGRVCYVTSTGEKYHFSSACAGENAITTTYYDALTCEYDPCSKCAK